MRREKKLPQYFLQLYPIQIPSHKILMHNAMFTKCCFFLSRCYDCTDLVFWLLSSLKSIVSFSTSLFSLFWATLWFSRGSVLKWWTVAKNLLFPFFVTIIIVVNSSTSSSTELCYLPFPRSLWCQSYATASHWRRPGNINLKLFLFLLETNININTNIIIIR